MTWKGKCSAALFALVVLCDLSVAGVIESSFMKVGISPFGNLFYHEDSPIYQHYTNSFFYVDYTSGGTGIVRKSDGWSPFRYPFPQEFWSITANSTTGVPFAQAYFSYGSYGSYDGSAYNNAFQSDPWTSTWGTDTASVTGTTSFLLRVTHDFSFAAPNILAIDGKVVNVSDSPAGDVLYKRGIDWALGSSIYGESASVPGIPSGTQLIDSTFVAQSPGYTPSMQFTTSCVSGCTYFYSSSDSRDVGAAMRLNLGILNPGESASFRLYYGISQVGQTPLNLVSQLQALGASYYILAYSPDGTKSAIMGYGLPSGADAVPEPSSVATWATAAFGLGAALVRRRRQMARKAAEGRQAVAES